MTASGKPSGKGADAGERGYQYEYSSGNEQMHSAQGRYRKAATMRAVLHEALGDKFSAARLLNLGCSTGFIDEYLAPHVGMTQGVDIDEAAIEGARARGVSNNSEFSIGDAMQLHFADASFDIVICSQVYEHVPDPVRMMGEIHRVLRPGGVCYFAATNRWALMERHYRLPFLSWLPVSLADHYVRLTGKGDAYYERHRGRGGLLGLARDFRMDDFTGKIVARPERYEAGYMFPAGIGRQVAGVLLKYLPGLFPGFIWLLWKD